MVCRRRKLQQSEKGCLRVVERFCDDRQNLFRGLADSVFKFIENEVEIMKPKRLLYLSFDGVAPIAKITLQRKRRIQGYEEDLNKLTSLLPKGLLGEAKHKAIENAKKTMLFRFELSPGTDLMRHLSARIKAGIEQKRQSCDKNWIGLKVVLSDTDVPGEGEHKIMSFIKEYGYENDQCHAIYSPDSDCSILALLTHEADLFVYSEVKGRASEERDEGGNIVQTQSQGQGQFYLKTEMSTMINAVKKAMNIKNKDRLAVWRQIQDFVFMCSPMGNDYLPLPAYPNLDLQHIIDAYRGNSGEYLTEFDQVNYDNISHFLRRLKKKEGELILSEKKKDVKDFRRRYYQEHGIDLQDLQAISDSAINYLKSWRCTWQMMITGSAPWKGSYCVNFAPMIFDIAQFNSKPCWDKGGPGLHLEPLAQLTLILGPKCIDTLPEEYKRFRMREDVRKLYGEAEGGMKIDAILRKLRISHLQSTLTVGENGTNEATGALFFPTGDDDIPDSIIRSNEDVPTIITEPSLRPFRFTLRADEKENWRRRLENAGRKNRK